MKAGEDKKDRREKGAMAQMDAGLPGILAELNGCKIRDLDPPK